MRRRPLLYDSRGQVVSYDFFEAGRVTGRREHPQRYYQSAIDTEELLPRSSWEQIMSSGRWLFANLPLVRGALLEQCLFSFPIDARYTGEDKQFKERAEAWRWEWRKTCALRGREFSGDMVPRLRLLGYKVDGDLGTAFTRDEYGYPRLQFVRGHRVKSRIEGKPLQKGPYRGMRIANGVVHDSYKRTVAYLLPGKTEPEDQWIPAHGMGLTYRPDYFDQWRGISHLVASIPDFSKVERLRKYEMRAQLVQSLIAITKKTETGYVDEAAGTMDTESEASASTTTGPDIATESLEDGLLMYLKANSGEELNLVRPDRPGPDSANFEDKIVTGCFYGIEWDPQFALALKEPGGAWARTILEKIRRAIKNNVAVEAAAEAREDWFAINAAIEIGELEPPTDGDTWSWEYHLAVPLVTADSGNDEAAKREAYKIGALSLDDWCASMGLWWEEHREQKETETKDLLNRAKGLQGLFPELTLQECVNLLEQRTPNANTAAPASDQAVEPKPAVAGKPKG